MIIDFENYTLLDASGNPIKLRKRSLNLLILLARNAGKTIEKNELLEKNWPNVMVTEESLSRCVSDIRNALGENYRHNLKTVSGRGYMVSGTLHSEPNYLQLASAKEALAPFVTARKPLLVAKVVDRAPAPGTNLFFLAKMADTIVTFLRSCRWVDTVDLPLQVGEQIGRQPQICNAGEQYGFEVTRWDSDELSIKLFELPKNTLLWSNHFSISQDLDEFDNLAFARKVVAFIDPILRAAEIQKAAIKADHELSPHDLFLIAHRFLASSTKQGFQEAERRLRLAVERDPQNFEAIALLADCVGRLALSGWVSDPTSARRDAYDLAERAIQIAPNRPHILAIGAWICATFSQKYERACELALRAIASNPVTPDVYSFCGWAYIFSGELQKALDLFECAKHQQALDERSHLYLLGIAGANYFLGNFDITLSLARRITADMPNNVVALRILLAALAQSGAHDEVETVREAILRLHPEFSLSVSRISIMQHAWMNDMWIEGLRAGGIPE